MEKLNPWVVGGALAITAVVLYSACAVAFALAPSATLDFFGDRTEPRAACQGRHGCGFNAWFHGLNLAGLQAGAKPFTLGGFIYGLAGLTGYALAAGLLFGAAYNRLRR